MPEKYIYNGQIVDKAEVLGAAKKSNLDVNAYLEKSGIKVVNDNYNFNGKIVPAEDVLNAANQSKLGFDDYIQKANIEAIPDVKKKETSVNGYTNGVSQFGTRDILNAGAPITNAPAPEVTRNPYAGVLGATQNADEEKRKTIYNEAAANKNVQPLIDYVNQEKLNIQKKKEQYRQAQSAETDLIGANDLLLATQPLDKTDETFKAEDDYIKNIQKNAISAIDTVAADKYEASPNKSAEVQSQLGSELRKQKAMIGADVSYSDEQSLANAKPATPSFISSTGIIIPTGQPVVDMMAIVNEAAKENQVIEAAGQRFEYKSRNELLNAVFQQQKEKRDNLMDQPEVQAYINGSEVERKALQNNPRVIEATQAAKDLINTVGQSNGLINQYPEVKAEQQSQMVASLFADLIKMKRSGELGTDEKIAAEKGFIPGSNLFVGTSLKDDKDIKRIAELSQTTGVPLTEDEVRKYADDAKIPSFAGLALRGFGGTIKETTQGLNRLLYSKEDADIQNKLIENTKYQLPEALQVSTKNINPSSILSTMFTTTGQVAAYGLEGYLGGEALGLGAKIVGAGAQGLGAATGLVEAGNLSRADLAAMQLGERILPANKLADMMVGLKLAETPEEAIGKIMAATNKAKNIGGTYGSMFATAYEPAYQEAARYTDDENKRKEYANSQATATALAFTVLNPAGLLEKGLISATSEGIAADFLKTGALPTAKDVLKARIGEVAKTVGLASAQSLIPVINSEIAKSNIFDYHTSTSEFLDQSANAALGMAVGILPFGILGASKIPSSEYSKSLLFEAGGRPDLVKLNIGDSYFKGEITNDEKNRQISIVNTLQNLVKSVPDKNNEGKLLSQPEKNNLVYLQLQHDALVRRKDTASDAMKPSYDAEIQKQQTAIDEIMGTKEQPEVTLTEDQIKTGEGQPPEKTLFEKVQENISTPKNQTEDEVKRAESAKAIPEEELMPQMTAQSIDAPTGVLNTLNGDRELTTELISQNSEADIEAARKKWANTDSETADDNVKLLEEGLAKKQSPSSIKNENDIKADINDFHTSYTGVHVDMRSGGNSHETKKSIQSEGFKEAFNVNAMPLTDDRNATTKKGQMIYIIPEKGLIDSGNGLKVKTGWKPSDLEVFPIEYDKQPIHEAYLNNAKKIAEQPPSSIVGEKGGENIPVVNVGDKFTFGGNEWTVTEDNGETVKATNGEVQTSFPKEDVALNIKGNEPPPEPPKEEPVMSDEEADKKFTAIRKEKQIEIEKIKQDYEKQGVKKWTESLSNGLVDLQSKYPNDNLYDASKKEATKILTAIQKGEKPSIDDETLAVMQNYKREASKRISELEPQLSSLDESTRQAAILQADALMADLYDAASVIKNGTTAAGRTLNYAQSELAFDPEYGLQIRRMQLQKANGGEPLTEEQMDKTAELWEQEKALIEKEHEIKTKKMQEVFDKQIADLHEDYKKQLAQKKGTPSKAPTKIEKTLSQKGKEAADRLRKGKLGGTQAVIFPGVKQAINLVIETIAQAVEKGATIAEAISDYIKAHVEKGKEDEFRNAFLGHVFGENKRPSIIEDITDHMKAEQDMGGAPVTDINKGMVARGEINKFVQSYLGEVPPKDILDQATKDLKETLPDVTRDKLLEAYLKVGDYELPTKEKLEDDIAKDRKTLNSLSKTEQDLNDLKKKKDIFKKKGDAKSVEEVDKEIVKRQKELETELGSVGQKIASEDKYQKASFESRAASHNERLDGISAEIQKRLDDKNTTDKEKAALQSLQQQISDSKIVFNEKSKLSQAPIIERGLTRLKEIAKSFKGDTEIKRLMQRAIDKFDKDKAETEQQIKLQRTKDGLEAHNRERTRKINAGEFGDRKNTVLSKSDIDLIKLQIQRKKLDAQYSFEKRKAEEKNKSFIRKTIDFTRAAYVAALIWKFGTMAKVAATSLIRPNVEAVTKSTFGNLFKLISPSVAERAKAGGEGSSMNTIKKIYEAYFQQQGEKGLSEHYETANKKYEAADKQYTEYAKSENPDPKKLQKLKNNRDEALIQATGNLVYEYIGGSSLKDALDVLYYRSSQIENQFGFLDKESIKQANRSEKLKYILDLVGRSHSAIKTFSGRASFAAGFIARLEAAQKEGKDISNPDTILQIAKDSYIDWDRGKYQQSNFVSDAWNSINRNLEREYKGKKWEKYAKGVSDFLKFDVAITRVPVNLLHEAVMEYTLGAFTALGKTAQTYSKARGEAKAEGLKTNTPEFKSAVKDYISKMDKDQAAMIVRSFRKGGFGLGLFALFALGGIVHYGGFHHRNESKKGKLKPGEIDIGDEHVPEIVSKIIEHTPGMYPTLLGLNTAKVYNDKIKKRETTYKAAAAAVMADLQNVQDQIPQTRVVNPIGITQQTISSFERQLGITKPKR